jgi:small subunit ribosomal protein S6
MRRYETIIITDPDVGEDARKTITAKIGELMAAEGGYLIKQDDWGVRKLAYEIRKKPRGYYTLFDFCGDGGLVDEIERQFRIDDRVLKYMTVVLDKEADLEMIKAEIAAATTTETPVEAAAAAPAGTAADAATEKIATAAEKTGAAADEKATTAGEAMEAPAAPAAEEEVKPQPTETAETESVEKE